MGKRKKEEGRSGTNHDRRRGNCIGDSGKVSS